MDICLPTLRERKDDLPALVKYFIGRLNEEYGRTVEDISDEALACLAIYDWPGNVRELRNTIERSMMLENSKTISAQFLSDEIKLEYANGPNKINQHQSALNPRPYLHVAGEREGISIADVERDLIQKGLEITGGNQTKAAEFLCISRDTLRYRMKKFGLA